MNHTDPTTNTSAGRWATLLIALTETGSPRAGPVFKSLIAYLRASMPQLNQSPATLGNELELVRSYLELMAMRMPDRLSYRLQADAALKSLRFPPMALLTLVENAVHHGIDPSVEGGQIEVGARQDPSDGSVRVWVTDTGVGMAETATPGTGLKNLRQRISAFFGPQAGLELSAPAPRGLRAEIHFVPET
ncbi:sensor histidine kinase [Rhodoferax sp.]|uniref:sensor histidine kinase n=1 Tax=Rhodoferax sp. TaxID=50421 RepID=UPI00275D4D01|nr:histidine kinase [Rhodoferax sp.]